MLQTFSRKNKELKMLDPLNSPLIMYNSKILSKFNFYSIMPKNRPKYNVYFGQGNWELPRKVLPLPFSYYVTCSTNQHKIHPCYRNNQSNEYQSFSMNTSRPVLWYFCQEMPLGITAAVKADLHASLLCNVLCFSDKNAFILELQKLLFKRFKEAKVLCLGFSGLNLQL